MRSTLLSFAALAAFISHTTLADVTLSPAPKGTIGHTATLANNTVFIQGGETPTSLTGASYAVLLTPQGSMNNATWQDTSSLSHFTPRDFFVSAAINSTMVNCGTRDGSHGAVLTCDLFDVTWYNNTRLNVPGSIPNRGGMASTVTNSQGKAYFVGGATYASNVLTGTPTVNVLTLSDLNVAWDTIPDMPLGLVYHTATWIEGPAGGLIVLGGQSSTSSFQPLGAVQFYNGSAWASPGLIVGGPAQGLNRIGHSATNDGNGTIYVFGGMIANGTAPANDLYILDTNIKPWAWIAGTSAPEARAFHTATLLPDKTILITFGQNGVDASTAIGTYMIYDTKTTLWSKIMHPPTIANITVSPNYVPPPPVVTPKSNPPPSSAPSNNPGSGSGSGSTNQSSGSGSGSKGINIPMIAGICGGVVALIFLIILIILLIRCRNRRNRPVRHYETGPKKDMTILYNNDDDDEKAKQAKAFMIRKPASVYVVDDQDPDHEIPHPHYKSGYYGDGGGSGRNSPSVAEYELTSQIHPFRNNTLSTVSSVAERRRYVEDQQRQLIDGYENTYHHPPPFESNSKEERYDDDDDVEESLPRRTGQNSNSGNGSSSAATGPRYPRNNRSNYGHPAEDYFE